MRCQTARRYMMERLFESLSLDRIDRLERHLERCPDCAREWDDVRHGHQFMSASRYPTAPPHLDQAVLDAARSIETEPAKRRYAKPLTALAAAASFLIAAAISIQLWMNDDTVPLPENVTNFNIEQKLFDTLSIDRLDQPSAELTAAPSPLRGVEVRDSKQNELAEKRDMKLYSVEYAAAKPDTNAPKQAEELFRTGMNLYDNAFTKIGDERNMLLKSAVLILQDVQEKYPEQHYWIALSHILIADSFRALGEPLDAIQTYRRMIDLFPDMSTYCQQARASIIQILLDREDGVAELEQALTQYYTLYPGASQFPEFALAYSGMIQSCSPETAVRWYQRVQEALPPAHPQRLKAERLSYTIEESIRKNHYINDWLVLGPLIQNVMWDNIEEVSKGGESSVMLNNLHSSNRGTPTFWIRIKSDVDTDITNVLKESPDKSCAFLKTAVYSPEKRQVAFLIGATNGFRLWFNGDQVFGRSWQNHFVRDTIRIQQELREGWNDIVVKCFHIRSDPDWKLSFIITDLEGHILNDLVVDPAKSASISMKE